MKLKPFIAHWYSPMFKMHNFKLGIFSVGINPWGIAFRIRKPFTWFRWHEWEYLWHEWRITHTRFT